MFGERQPKLVKMVVDVCKFRRIIIAKVLDQNVGNTMQHNFECCQILKGQLAGFLGLEKEFKMSTCLQRSVPIQPKTSQSLPRKIVETGPNCATIVAINLTKFGWTRPPTRPHPSPQCYQSFAMLLVSFHQNFSLRKLFCNSFLRVLGLFVTCAKRSASFSTCRAPSDVLLHTENN